MHGIYLLSRHVIDKYYILLSKRDIRIFVFCRDGSLQKCFLAITQKVLGVHQKNVHILIPLVESFDLSYV